MGNSWIIADKEGLGRLVAEHKPEAMIEVAFSNTFDQKAKNITVDLTAVEDAKGTYVFRVTDDDPDGFTDLGHAYTLYAESAKKGDPNKRGRFNMGEKLLLSLCSEARVTSTSGSVYFRPDGTRTQGKTATEAGTEVEATIALTKAEVARWEHMVRMVIVPKGVTVTYNDEELARRETVHTIPVKALDTVLGPELRPTKRNSRLELIEVLAGEQPYLYELGIPVVALIDGMTRHVNVMQKVPVSMTRDNVPPPYLRRIHAAVLDATFEDISPEEANAVWVKNALTEASPEAVRKVITERFGEGAVAFDPTDIEANKLATASGLNVVGGRALSKDEWEAVREAGVLPRAGKVTPSPKVRGDGKTDVPESNWTDAQCHVVEYAAKVAEALIGFPVTVKLAKQAKADEHGHRFAAWYGDRTLTLNLSVLGKAWFEQPDEVKVDALLIHELGHEYSSDHLSHEFHDALCDLGARLRNVGIRL